MLIVGLALNASHLRRIQAAKEWATQEMATTLTQSYRHLLMRPMTGKASLSQKFEAGQKRDQVHSGYEGSC